MVFPLRLCGKTLAFALVALLAGAASSSASPPGTRLTTERLVREGMAVDFEIESFAGKERLEEGDNVALRFKITDIATGTPLSGVFPAAWMDLRPEAEESTTKTCRDKIEAFIGGSLLSPPELDLNIYHVLALNHDGTISVVDPLFGFGTTRLLDMIFLPGTGYDWVLSDDQRQLYVSVPEAGVIAVADTSTWKVVAEIPVGERPGRIALQADGRYLWVGHGTALGDGAPAAVSVVDTASRTVVAAVPTGAGPHTLALEPDNLRAWVLNRGAGTVSVVEVASLAEVTELPVGEKPISIAFSATGRAAYAVDAAAGIVTVVDAAEATVRRRIRAEPGLGEIAFTPDGRLAFLVNPEADLLHILDPATDRIVQTADMEDGPDQVAFTDELAYIRHRGSEIIYLIPLSEVGFEGRPVPVLDFPGGHTPFGAGVKDPSPAAGIVQAPGASAVLVANPADRTIYYYKEGMAAPMGHFQNYSRHPRAVLAVDRSLSERRQAGTYETAARLRRPGLYDVAFFLDSPRTFHCFEVEVAPNPELERQRLAERKLAVEHLGGYRVMTVGETVALRFRLTDPLSAEPRSGLTDVRVLTFLGSGQGQERHAAVPRGDGLYEVPFTPERAGVYYVFVESPKAGLGYRESPFITLRVTAGEEEADGAPKDRRGGE